MTTRFSRPNMCRYEVSDRREPYGPTGERTRLSITATGTFTVVDALELAETITFEARRAEEKNLQAIVTN